MKELLDEGTTTVTKDEILKRFPTRVHDPVEPATPRSLEDWAYGFRGQASGLFNNVKNLAVGALRTRISPVNMDSTGGWRWAALPGRATDIAVGGDRSVWSIGPIGTDGNGPVQCWDAASSSWKAVTGAGTRIAVDGAGVVWVVNATGYSYRKPLGGTSWERGQRPKVHDVDGLVEIAAGADGSVWGLAKAAVNGGHQLLRCVAGAGTHSWVEVGGGATSVSVAPDGLPWVVNSAGIVMSLTPGTGADRYTGDGALWTDVGIPGRKATDIGVGVGPLLSAWITTDGAIYGWNGRGPNTPARNARLPLDWEDMGGGGTRIATGPDGLPWLVSGSGAVWRLVAAGTATAEFRTGDAGKVRGRAVAVDGSLFQGESVSIDGSTDLSKVIVGNSGARVFSIELDRSPLPGEYYRLSIDGQGPAGLGSGSCTSTSRTRAGSDDKQFWSSQHHTLTIDYNGNKAGIRRISWSDSSTDPR